MSETIVRRPSSAECPLVRSLVQTVVDETYGGLWALPPLHIDEEDWSLAWIAVARSEIAGMILTDKERIGDLWVLRSFRGAGVGSALLAKGEAEIRVRGYRDARLRVVRSNTAAIAFYARHGWQAVGEFPHEHVPIAMVEMMKPV